MLSGVLFPPAMVLAISMGVVQPSGRDAVSETRRVVPDTALAAAIRAELGLEAGHELRPDDVARLTALRTVGAGIESLTGLEHAVGLERLVVGANRISDLSPLARLPRLVALHAWNNRIRDLAPLAGLTGLRELQLGANTVTDVSPLGDLTALEWLDLVGNDVGDLRPLRALTRLRWLDLRANDVSDLRPLAGLVALERLWLWSNGITTIEPLRGLDRMQWLTLGGNQLSDVSVLLDLGALHEVSFPNNYVDMTDGSAARNIVSALRGRGVTVHAEPQLIYGIHQRR